MKINLKIYVLSLFIVASINLFSQTAPFTISIEPLNITDLGGIHSYAFGQNNGKWLIVGGRLDGLHEKQASLAFDIEDSNNQLIVVDPITQQKWSAPLTSLPISIQEQLSSTNMEFYQENDYLYFIGGYGYSAAIGDHITFSYLTAIKVSDVINAVINTTDFTSFFRQINDPEFQVTGGRLKKINTNFYLLGGQKYTGRYSSGSGSGNKQEYTNSIRIFSLIDDGTTIIINHLSSYTDSENLHRRDYNAESQIMPNGEEGITMFSGVFQQSVNLPFLNSVDVDVNGYTVNNTFQQYYNNYHCGVIPLYSASNNEMHTLFFGGIAQYYDSSGILVQDDNVPFVKTIARVTRDTNGVMAEYKLPIEMPELLGSGAEFIPNLSVSHYSNDVFKLDDITNDNTLLGYIYGGISSSALNIFNSNNGTQSNASSQIFKVYLTKNTTLSIDDLNEQSIGSLKLIVYPNPGKDYIYFKYNLIKNEDVYISIADVTGKLISDTILENQSVGENTYSYKINNLLKGGVYFITLKTPYEKSTQKLIIKN